LPERSPEIGETVRQDRIIGKQMVDVFFKKMYGQYIRALKNKK